MSTTIGLEPMKIWDTTSWEEVASFGIGAPGLVSGRLLDDGKTLVATEKRNGRIHIWRAPSWEEIDRIESTERD